MEFNKMILYTAMGPITVMPNSKITWLEVDAREERRTVNNGDDIPPAQLLKAISYSYRIETLGEPTYIVPVETIAGAEIR